MERWGREDVLKGASWSCGYGVTGWEGENEAEKGN